MGFAILVIGTETPAVGQNGLEAVEIATRHIDSPIGDQPGKMLLDALPHDARFAMMRRKAFFVQDCSDVDGEAFNAPLELLATGKCQIIGIARVLCARRFREPGETSIQAIGTGVGNRRGSGSALR